MNKKRSIGVTIFGWCQILLGAIGSIPVLDTARIWLVIQHKDAAGYYTGFLPGFSDRLYLVIDRAISMEIFPLCFFLISGILVLRLSPSARRLNTVFLPLLLIAEIAYLLQTSTHSYTRSSLFLVCMYLGIVIFQLWFFARPKVKEQFARRE